MPPTTSRRPGSTQISLLDEEIARQRERVEHPEAAAQRAKESIERGIEMERQPAKPAVGAVHTKFINPPPARAPSYFQDRHVETELIGTFLQDDTVRLISVVGRGGTGKTAMVCRLLKSLEGGQLPDDGGPLSVDGIVYISRSGSRPVNLPNLYADLAKLLPDDRVARLEGLYKAPQATTVAKMRALLEAFPSGRTVLLLDNFEDVVDPATLNMTDPELEEGLRALLQLPEHGVKVIVTTRLAPRSLALVEPGQQRRLDLDEGLSSPYAEQILQAMDADGTLGLKTAEAALLNEARLRTRGYPRALEALFAILSADRDTSLPDLLKHAERRNLLPENVVDVLVGEAFSRLDPAAQQVMQALAVFARPVPPAAVDHLLQPYIPGMDSAPVLRRLVNMKFARGESGRYHLHPVDLDTPCPGCLKVRRPIGRPSHPRSPASPCTTRLRSTSHRPACRSPNGRPSTTSRRSSPSSTCGARDTAGTRLPQFCLASLTSTSTCGGSCDCLHSSMSVS